MGLTSVGSDIKLKDQEIIDSWKTKIQIHETKLREPQKSALLKCIGYEIDDSANDPVIVNMPTGTGKIGVIASLIFKSIFKRTLVIVPSDALRTQLADDLVDMDKYSSWNIIPPTSKKPKIAKLEPGNLQTLDINSVDDFFVIVATPQILESIKKREL